MGLSNVFAIVATKITRGAVRPGAGLGIDELGTLFLDNSHDPRKMTAGELYCEPNQTVPLKAGDTIFGTLGLIFASFTNRLAAMHIGGSQTVGAMTVSGLTNAGTGATCVVTGNDVQGAITFTPGSAAWAAGAQFSVAFKTAFLTAPAMTLTPTNTQAGTNMGTRGVSIATSTAGFTVTFGTAVAAATPWTWFYTVAGL